MRTRQMRLPVLTAAACVVASLLVMPPVAAEAAGSSSGHAPIKIAFLNPETGTYALPGRNNGVELAAKELNEHGGVNGHKIEISTYDTGITATATVTAVQKALSNDPTAMIGIEFDAQVEAAASLIRQSGVPYLSLAEGPDATPSELGLKNGFVVVPSTYLGIEGSSSYAMKQYHPKTVGVFNTTGPAGTTDVNILLPILKKDGVKNIVHRTAAIDATDATEQALDMKSVDVAWTYGYPNVIALFLRAMNQNGITPHVMGDQGATGGAMIHFGSTPADLHKFVYVSYCEPEVLNTPKAKAFVAASSAAYDTPPANSNSAQQAPSYDAVYLVANAVKTGGTSHASMVKALSHTTYSGVCGTYHADHNGDMMHQVQLVSLTNGATSPTLVHIYHGGAIPKKLLHR